jgi:hypothetical protein
MSWWWLSSVRMTVGVQTDARAVITDGAPIIRTFIGQPIRNLADWMRKQGGFRGKLLDEKES